MADTVPHFSTFSSRIPGFQPPTCTLARLPKLVYRNKHGLQTQLVRNSSAEPGIWSSWRPRSADAERLVDARVVCEREAAGLRMHPSTNSGSPLSLWLLYLTFQVSELFMVEPSVQSPWICEQRLCVCDDKLSAVSLLQKLSKCDIETQRFSNAIKSSKKPPQKNSFAQPNISAASCLMVAR